MRENGLGFFAELRVVVGWQFLRNVLNVWLVDARMKILFF